MSVPLRRTRRLPRFRVCDRCFYCGLPFWDERSWVEQGCRVLACVRDRGLQMVINITISACLFDG